MKLFYSQIVKRKLKILKRQLTLQFDEATALKGIKAITTAVRGLEEYPYKGLALSDMYDIDTDFRYLYIKHNYIFYYVEEERIIIAELFDEREDFIYKLFGISSRSQESIDYWGE